MYEDFKKLKANEYTKLSMRIILKVFKRKTSTGTTKTTITCAMK